jgi:hypothetical protein
MSENFIQPSCAMRIISIIRLWFCLGIIVALPFMLSACDTVDETAVAEDAPPSMGPEPDFVPVIQNPQGEIWRPGYWAMSHNNFIWVPGKIIPRPDPTAIWTQARWVHHTYGWSFEEGHWE